MMTDKTTAAKTETKGTAKASDAAIEKAAAAKKTETPAAPKKIAGHPATAKIAFGKNAEGKPYHGKDNNPKRAGSKAHGSFALYKEGMTLEQVQAAGVKASDISWDLKHDFIKIAA